MAGVTNFKIELIKTHPTQSYQRDGIKITKDEPIFISGSLSYAVKNDPNLIINELSQSEYNTEVLTDKKEVSKYQGMSLKELQDEIKKRKIKNKFLITKKQHIDALIRDDESRSYDKINEAIADIESEEEGG